jgi:hypothetical protein
MAVNRIKNKHVVDRSEMNRGKQVSLKDTTARSITPGKDLTKNYAITLKDVDTTIISHVKNVMRPMVKEANEIIKVPIYYGNEERWSAFRKKGVLRDKNNSLILPLIMLKRVSVENNEMTTQDYAHDVLGENTTVLRSSQWSKNNRYDNFSVLTGVKPQYENLLTTTPNFRNISYDFIIWTNFIEQMNDIVELFIEESNKYWGDSQEYKFHCNIDTITDASEMSVDDERFIRSTFSVTTKAYLLPEYMNSVVTNKKATLIKELTPRKVVFNSEIIIDNN